MLIYEQIEEDLNLAVREKDTSTRSILRVLKAEIQRNYDKNYTDEYVINVIIKMIKSLDEVNNEQSKLEKAKVIKYLPTKVTEEEVFEYIKTISNVDQKRMIGMILKKFPKGTLDSKFAQNVISKYFNN